MKHFAVAAALAASFLSPQNAVAGLPDAPNELAVLSAQARAYSCVASLIGLQIRVKIDPHELAAEDRELAIKALARAWALISANDVASLDENLQRVLDAQYQAKSKAKQAEELAWCQSFGEQIFNSLPRDHAQRLLNSAAAKFDKSRTDFLHGAEKEAQRRKNGRF